MNVNDEYDVRGSEIVSSTMHPMPYNPLLRPKIKYKNAVCAFAVFVLLVVAFYLVAGCLLKGVTYGKSYRIIGTLGVANIYLFLISKRAIIWMVHFYQRVAPDRVRLRCVYHPSCSEYMILSVKKYGTIRGVWKGLCRLFRCHPPNHGIDYP